eukprot:1178567-Prorocentrum_minimum.AAC.1
MQRRPAHNPNDPGAGSDLRKVPAIVSELIPAKKAYGLVVEGRPPPGLDRGGFETQQHTLHGYTKGQITPSKPSERIILFHSTPQQISTRYQAAARFSHERYSIRNEFLDLDLDLDQLAGGEGEVAARFHNGARHISNSDLTATLGVLKVPFACFI